jgi:hypothetical protein
MIDAKQYNTKKKEKRCLKNQSAGLNITRHYLKGAKMKMFFANINGRTE